MFVCEGEKKCEGSDPKKVFISIVKLTWFALHSSDWTFGLNQQVASEQGDAPFIRSSELDPSLSRLGSSP